MIQESPEQTSPELMTHSVFNAPMRLRTHPRNVELFSELTERRLNAAAQADLEFPESLGILIPLIASQRWESIGVFGFQ